MNRKRKLIARVIKWSLRVIFFVVVVVVFLAFKVSLTSNEHLTKKKNTKRPSMPAVVKFWERK